MDCYFRNEKGNCRLDRQLHKKLPRPCPNNTICYFYINVPPDVLISTVLGRSKRFVRGKKVVRRVGSGGMRVYVRKRR